MINTHLSSRPEIDMDGDCQHLKASDHDELMGFLGRAYQETQPFNHIFPSLYQPTDEHMGCLWAQRRDGRLAAVAGLFPIRLLNRDDVLEIAGVGGVAVDPQCRNQGLMRRLVAHLRSRIVECGYPVSYLGGQRQRYRYWGWERCGTVYQFSISPANIKHEPESLGPRSHVISEMSADELSQARQPIQRLRERCAVRCAREHSPLENYLRFRGATVLRAHTADAAWSGYAAFDPGRCELHEVAALGPDAALALVGGAAARCCGDRCLTALVPTYADRATIQAIGGVAETSEITHGGNWQVFDWPETVRFMLAVQLRARPLPRGSIIVAVRGEPSAMEIAVREDGATCAWSDAEPAIVADACTMARLLFGPLPPAAVIPLPPAASLLEAWCPLPLGLGRLDRV